MTQEDFNTVRDTKSVYGEPEGRFMCISWRAIIAGWLVGFAIALFLYFLGSAIGMTSVVNMSDVESAGSKAAIGATIWMFITWLVSLYFGSFFAAKASRTNSYNGMLQGVGVWALSSVLTIIIGLSGVSAVGIMSMQVVKGAAQGVVNVAEEAGDIQVPTQFQAQLKQSIFESASSGSGINSDKLKAVVDKLNPQILNDIGEEFLKGDVEGAKNALIVNTSLTEDEIDRVVSSLSSQTQELKAEIEEAARKVAGYNAVALWFSVFISLFSLGAAMFGGKSGAYIKT